MQKQHKIFNRRTAFTLSEVLITLSLMGVVMAFTIPTLIHHTNNDAYVNGLRKVYGEFDTATNRLMIENGSTIQNVVTANDNIGLINRYCSVLECLKICPAGTVNGNCFPAPFTTLNKNPGWFDPEALGGAVLADGMMFTLNAAHFPNCNSIWMTDSAGNNIGCGSLFVDVNGLNGPNIVGRDIFTFIISTQGIIPCGAFFGSRPTFGGTGANLTDWGTFCDPASAALTDGNGCAGRVLSEGTMTY
jgi:prepilin-type N-terminal cleavage/methylation domain-containing protein